MLNRYLDTHPSVRDATVATFQGIVHSAPLPSPAVTLYVDDCYEQEALPPKTPEPILRREQEDDTGRAGLRESFGPLEVIYTRVIGPRNSCLNTSLLRFEPLRTVLSASELSRFSLSQSLHIKQR